MVSYAVQGVGDGGVVSHAVQGVGDGGGCLLCCAGGVGWGGVSYAVQAVGDGGGVSYAVQGVGGGGGCLLCCVRTVSIFEAKPGEALTLEQGS